MDNSGLDPSAFKVLWSATDLNLRAKMTAQAIGRHLERHLWLNLTEVNVANKTALLDSPVSPMCLFRLGSGGLRPRST